MCAKAINLQHSFEQAPYLLWLPMLPPDCLVPPHLRSAFQSMKFTALLSTRQRCDALKQCSEKVKQLEVCRLQVRIRIAGSD